MKIGETAKRIDGIINPTGRYNSNKLLSFKNKPSWNDKREIWDKVTSTVIAQRYAKIIEMVKDANAKVKVEGKLLKIIYGSGYATIGIDEIVKKILIPELSQYIVND